MNEPVKSISVKPSGVWESPDFYGTQEATNNLVNFLCGYIKNKTPSSWCDTLRDEPQLRIKKYRSIDDPFEISDLAVTLDT